MSACALRRWGTACSSVRPPDTGQSKEMEKSLQMMIAERNKQDTMWQQPSVSELSKPSFAPNVPNQNQINR